MGLPHNTTQMRELNIIKGEWRAWNHSDIYAKGYFVATTRGSLFTVNNHDIDHALLIADAGNTYQATGMLPSEMAERIKALEDALRKVLREIDYIVEDGTLSAKDVEINPSLRHARGLLTPINEAHAHMITKPE